MVTFLEYKDFSQVQVYLCQILKEDYLPILAGEKSLPVQKMQLQTWSDLASLSQEESALFEADSLEENQVFWLDIGDLRLDKKTCEFLKSLQASSDQYFFHSKRDILAEEKKHWTGANLSWQKEDKYEEKIKLDLIKRYSEQIDFKLNSNQQKILLNSENYAQIIDSLDLLSLAQNHPGAEKMISSQVQLLPFMQSFEPGRISKFWSQQVSEGDLQLFLASIYTKILKQNRTDLVKKLIQTDQKIKQGGKTPALTWYKFFLWEANQQK